MIQIFNFLSFEDYLSTQGVNRFFAAVLNFGCLPPKALRQTSNLPFFSPEQFVPKQWRKNWEKEHIKPSGSIILMLIAAKIAALSPESIIFKIIVTEKQLKSIELQIQSERLKKQKWLTPIADQLKKITEQQLEWLKQKNESQLTQIASQAPLEQLAKQLEWLEELKEQLHQDQSKCLVHQNQLDRLTQQEQLEEKAYLERIEKALPQIEKNHSIHLAEQEQLAWLMQQERKAQKKWRTKEISLEWIKEQLDWLKMQDPIEWIEEQIEEQLKHTTDHQLKQIVEAQLKRLFSGDSIELMPEPFLTAQNLGEITETEETLIHYLIRLGAVFSQASVEAAIIQLSNAMGLGEYESVNLAHTTKLLQYGFTLDIDIMEERVFFLLNQLVSRTNRANYNSNYIGYNTELFLQTISALYPKETNTFLLKLLSAHQEVIESEAVAVRIITESRIIVSEEVYNCALNNQKNKFLSALKSTQPFLIQSLEQRNRPGFK